MGVEGRAGDAYHVVDRWSPGAGRFRDLGALFLRLAGLGALVAMLAPGD